MEPHNQDSQMCFRLCISHTANIVPVFEKIDNFFINQVFGMNRRAEFKWDGFGVFYPIKLV